MSTNAADMVRALVELSRTLQNGDAFLRDVRDGLTAQVGDRTLHVTITTPTGDAGELRTEIERMAREKFKRDVRITERSDKSVIGGAIITVGDEQIDMSVRGSLEKAAAGLARASTSQS